MSAIARHDLEAMVRMEARLIGNRKRSRSQFVKYINRMNPTFPMSRVHYEIAEFIEWLLETPGARGMIHLPPRHAKSEIGSKRAPAYAIGRNPDWGIIHVSHTQEMADRFSRAVRNDVRDDRYPFRGIELGPVESVSLSKDHANIQRWSIQGRRGEYVAAGIGGPITGYGADLMIIDDPVKTRADAESENYREKQWEWWRGTARSRLQPGGRVLLIMTRWHVDDLAGRLQASNPGRWRILNLPAISDEGEALWPEHIPIKELLEIREDVGDREFESQYQQKPTKTKGGILDPDYFFEFDTVPQDATQYVMFADTAWKTEKRHDYTVFITVAVNPVHPTEMYIVDVWRQKLEYADLEGALKARVQQWRPTYVDIEDKSSGTALISWGRRQPGFPPITARSAVRDEELQNVPGKDLKEAMANLASPHILAGRVGIPRHAPWKDDLKDEVRAFPHAKHDDQVDTLTAAIRKIFGNQEGGYRAHDTTNYEDDNDWSAREELYE